MMSRAVAGIFIPRPVKELHLRVRTGQKAQFPCRGRIERYIRGGDGEFASLQHRRESICRQTDKGPIDERGIGVDAVEPRIQADSLDEACPPPRAGKAPRSQLSSRSSPAIWADCRYSS